jgi:hypothetical protein
VEAPGGSAPRPATPGAWQLRRTVLGLPRLAGRRAAVGRRERGPKPCRGPPNPLSPPRRAPTGAGELGQALAYRCQARASAVVSRAGRGQGGSGGGGAAGAAGLIRAACIGVAAGPRRAAAAAPGGAAAAARRSGALQRAEVGAVGGAAVWLVPRGAVRDAKGSAAAKYLPMWCAQFPRGASPEPSLPRRAGLDRWRPRGRVPRGVRIPGKVGAAAAAAARAGRGPGRSQARGAPEACPTDRPRRGRAAKRRGRGGCWPAPGDVRRAPLANGPGAVPHAPPAAGGREQGAQRGAAGGRPVAAPRERAGARAWVGLRGAEAASRPRGRRGVASGLRASGHAVAFNEVGARAGGAGGLLVQRMVG